MTDDLILGQKFAHVSDPTRFYQVAYFSFTRDICVVCWLEAGTILASPYSVTEAKQFFREGFWIPAAATESVEQGAFDDPIRVNIAAIIKKTQNNGTDEAAGL